MNAAQLERLARLVREAVHPRTDPLDGQPYTDEERADWRPASLSVGGAWIDELRYGGDGTEYITVKLTPEGVAEREVELEIDGRGRLCQTSHIQIPSELTDCECAGPAVTTLIGNADRDTDRAARNVAAAKRESCPRHGAAIRELECVRVVTAIGWEIADRPSALRSTTRAAIGGHDSSGQARIVPVTPIYEPVTTVPCWKYVVRLEDPTHDVLAKYAVEREAGQS